MPILPTAPRSESRRAPVILSAPGSRLHAAYLTVLGDPRGPDLSTDEVWVQAISPAHPPDVHRLTVQELRAAKREGRAARDAQGREVFRSPCAVLDHAGTVTPVPGLTPLTALARLDGLTGPHEYPSHVVSVTLSTQADLKDTLHALLDPAECA